MSASLDLVNRFAGLLDDEESGGDKGKKTQKAPAHGQVSGAPKKDLSRSAKKNVAHALEVAAFNQSHPQGSNDRHGQRVQDRFHNRRGGASSFRGREYIGDTNERSFDRRGAPTKHRGGLHKGGVLLGNEADPNITKPLSDTAEGESSVSDFSGEGGEIKSSEVEFQPIDPEEEAEAKKKTYEEYLEELRKKTPEDDLKKQVREAQNDEKQWKKVVALKKPEDETVSFGKNQTEEGKKDEENDKKNKTANHTKKEKKVISLDEFVGGTPASSAAPARGGYRGGSRGGARGGGRGAKTPGQGVNVSSDEEFPALGK